MENVQAKPPLNGNQELGRVLLLLLYAGLEVTPWLQATAECGEVGEHDKIDEMFSKLGWTCSW